MRISKGALLVVIAVLVPVIVELRTALSWFGIELSILESLGLSAVLILGLVLWAVWPPDGDAEADPSSSN
ncbi:CbaC protein [Natrinema sp. CBA1119]|uniref:CbaC protein n=1 Tax=Natrinema sp. CBA1119 TaxID=1608465 RepID=UPI000BFA6A68|nr:CbaC protein [Natrinema sp. CBA1119]PGF15544.1 CbaC protein [Natrinema sp. CBA1119]